MLMMMLVMMTIMIRMTTVLVVSVSGRIGAPPVNLAARCEKPLDRSREELPPTCRVRRRAIIPLSGALPEICYMIQAMRYRSGDEIYHQAMIWAVWAVVSDSLWRPEVARFLLELAAHRLRHLLA